MIDYVVRHPTPAEERAARWEDIEDMITCLQDIGWTLEKFTQTDESGEPLRAYLRLTYSPPPPFGGIL